MFNVHVFVRWCAGALFIAVLLFASGNESHAQVSMPPTIYTQVSTLPVSPGVTVIPVFLKLQGLPSTSVVDVNFWKVVAMDPITGAPVRSTTCTATVSLAATWVDDYPGYPQLGTHFDGFTAYTSLIAGSGPYIVSFKNSGAEVATQVVNP